MKSQKADTRRRRPSQTQTVRDNDRRKEERYYLIKEIASSRRQIDAYIDFAYGSSWDDR